MSLEAAEQAMDELMDQEVLRRCVIVHANVVHTIAVDYLLLATDVRRWAMARAEEVEREGGRAFASGLYRWALDGTETADSLTALRNCSEWIFRRARFGFLKVTEFNFEDYVQAILNSATPAKLDLKPAFLFVTGPRQPQIFATQEVSYLKKYSEKWIRWEVVTRSELRSHFDRVAGGDPSFGSTAVPLETLKHRLEPDDPAFRKRRQALLLIAQIFDISVTMSDAFATDLDALEARLAAHPEWPALLFEEVLQAALVVVSTNSDWMARRRSNMKQGSSRTRLL
jgi:hypothetical protein